MSSSFFCSCGELSAPLLKLGSVFFSLGYYSGQPYVKCLRGPYHLKRIHTRAISSCLLEPTREGFSKNIPYLESVTDPDVVLKKTINTRTGGVLFEKLLIGALRRYTKVIM